MIVKNEEKYLAKCLDSVKELVDEMIIVDTGSIDATLDIAKEYGAKIFSFQWDNNFSHARNFCISQASCEWLLLLDADEILSSSSKEAFTKLINGSTADGCYFKLYNYNGVEDEEHFIIHEALRLLRNHRPYEYRGAIHEQVTSIENSDSILSPFTSEDIILYHYGYLNDVVRAKQKHERNIPLIQTQLETEPNNPFYLFNLGNEYLALQDCQTALSYYQKAFEYIIDFRAGFIPHLYYKTICCLLYLGDFKQTISLVTQGLQHFPLFADLLYFKGVAYYNTHHYFLAIETLRRYLDMPTPPAGLQVTTIKESATPYKILGELYERVEADELALNSYTHVLSLNSNLYHILYKIAPLLKRYYKDSQMVATTLARYFTNLSDGKHLIIYVDLLFSIELYEEASSFMHTLRNMKDFPLDALYLCGKYELFTHPTELTYYTFREILDLPYTPSLLPDVKSNTLKLLFIYTLLYQEDKIPDILQLIHLSFPIPIQKVYEVLYGIYCHQNLKDLPLLENPSISMPIVFDFLDSLLKLKAYDDFEKYLYALNLVNSNEVLLELAQLYDKHGLKDMAKSSILRSIKELDTINRSAAHLLGALI